MIRVLIYVNCGEGFGFGHIKRSLSIAEFLKKAGIKVSFKGKIDKLFVKKISKNFEINSNILVSPNVIIIDSVEIDDDFRTYIQNNSINILISPVFDNYDGITHVCSRSVLPSINKKNNYKAIINPYFAFWGLELKYQKAFKSKKELRVGICISGSREYFDLSNLVYKLSALQLIKVIKVFDVHSKFETNICPKLILIRGFKENIWNYLTDIDVFITGDGLMIYESVMRGLPTISLQRKNQIEKNSFFSGKLFLSLHENDWHTNKICKYISNLELLSKLSFNIQNSNIKDRVDDLGNTVLEIIKPELSKYE